MWALLARALERNRLMISTAVREAKLESVPASCSLLRVVSFSRSAALLHVDHIVALRGDR